MTKNKSVYATCVDGEDGHEEDDVSAPEEDVKYLGDFTLLLQRLLGKDHPEGGREHDEPVARISEHHGEQEGEGGDRVHGWIHLSDNVPFKLISRYLHSTYFPKTESGRSCVYYKMEKITLHYVLCRVVNCYIM